MPNRYKLVGLQHLDLASGNVKELNTGDIVEDERDLEKLFPNVWARVAEGPGAANAAMLPRSRVINPAAANTQQPVGAAISTGPDKAETPEEHLPAFAAPPEEELGADHTEEFEAAGPLDVKVYKKGKSYHVYDADRVGVPLPDSEGLTSKAKVEDFLASYDKDAAKSETKK